MPASNKGENLSGCRDACSVLILTILASILVYGIAAVSISAFYHPDIDAALRLAKALSVRHLVAFRPEPKEKALFLAALLTIPASLAVFYPLFRALLPRFEARTRNVLYHLLIVAGMLAIISIGYAGFTAANPFHTDVQNYHDRMARTNLDFFITGTFLSDHFYIYSLAVFPLLLLGLLFGGRNESRSGEMTRRIFPAVAVVSYSVLLLMIVGINTFRFPYTFENKYDFNSVFYSVVQVCNGVPMLVDNFTNTYGLYPHFLAPLFKVCRLSIFSFSALMSAVTALCFLALLFFLYRNVKSGILRFLCFCSVFFYSHLYFRTVMSYDSIFVYQPIRFLFPILCLCLSGIYVDTRSGTVRFSSLFLLSLGILWNPEFGMIAFVAYLLFLIYVEFQTIDLKDAASKSFFHVLAAGSILAFTCGLYAVVIRLSYGSFPNLPELFSTFKVFSIIGAGMLPMPLFHPWNLIVLIYIIGLACSVGGLFSKGGAARNGMIFIITLLGVGTFSYYQGRSHNWNLMGTFVFAFILLAMFADSLLERVKQERVLFFPLALIVFILGSSFLQVGYAAGQATSLLTESANKARGKVEQDLVFFNADFIRQNVREREKVLILVQDYHQGLYYVLSGTSAAINPGLQDMFLRSDYDRLVSFLMSNRGTKVFFEPRSFASFDNRIEMVISTFYTTKKTNGMMMLLERKRPLETVAVPQRG